MNVVYLLGRIGKVEDMRYTQGGKAVINFSLATNEGYGDRQTTTWHDIVAWDKQAEFVAKYLDKGAQILIEGSIRRRSWEAQDGSKRSKVEVHAYRITSLSKPEEGRRGNGGRGRDEAEDNPWGGGDNEPRDVDPDTVPDNFQS